MPTSIYEFLIQRFGRDDVQSWAKIHSSGQELPYHLLDIESTYVKIKTKTQRRYEEQGISWEEAPRI